MKKVSIVVPVYNVEEYLSKCLDSLVSQACDDYKIIIVNDGTKDNSQEIIDDYKTKYPQLVESYIKENGGLADARNYGLKYVDTPYVMFIDSDDYVKENLVSRCLETIEKESSDIVVFNYTTHYISNDTFEDFNLELEGNYSLEINPEILIKTPNAAWNKIYKTSLFKDNNIEYPKGVWYEDLGTTPILLSKAKSITYIKDCLYIYQADRPNNIMSSVSEKTIDVIKSLKIVCDSYKENGIFEKYYPELNYLANRNLITISRIVINSKDKNFVNKFIDERTVFKKDYFPIRQTKYKIVKYNDDRIYESKVLSKLYYSYKHR